MIEPTFWSKFTKALVSNQEAELPLAVEEGLTI